MWFIVLGVLMVAMKLGDVGLVANWAWWVVLLPFAGAAAWWAYADASGLTKKREMDKMEAKKLARRAKHLDALGINRDKQKTMDGAERARRDAAKRVEGQRSQRREHNEQVIRDSVMDSQQSSSFDDMAARGDEPPAKTK